MRIAKGILVAMILGSATALVTGCGAKVSGGSPESGNPDFRGGFADRRQTIPGPDLSGHWVSTCHKKSGVNQYRHFDLVFAGATVQRTEAVFQDSSCKTSVKNMTYRGRYRFIDTYKDGALNIEYAFDLGNHVTTFPQEKILFHDQLFLSDFVVGEGATVLMDEPLQLATVAPQPSTMNAQIVSQYADAKFAYCSTQGQGAMIDLSGLDITKAGTGLVRVGFKKCGSPIPIVWSGSQNSASVTMNAGQPQIEISGFDFSTYIHPHEYQSGLNGGRGAYGVIAGNSGDCFFSANAGTLNVPFNYDCD